MTSAVTYNCKNLSPTVLLNYFHKLRIYFCYESKWYTVFFSPQRLTLLL